MSLPDQARGFGAGRGEERARPVLESASLRSLSPLLCVFVFPLKTNRMALLSPAHARARVHG